MHWTWWFIRLSSWTLLLVVLVGISLSNREVISLKLPALPYVAHMPLYVLVVVSVMFGFALSWLQHLPRSYRRWVEHRSTRAKLQAVSTELAAMKMEQQPTATPPVIHDSSTSTQA